ncbi:hypothetical protein SEVIR_4G139401v4 [Setaria viridis]
MLTCSLTPRKFEVSLRSTAGPRRPEKNSAAVASLPLPLPPHLLPAPPTAPKSKPAFREIFLRFHSAQTISAFAQNSNPRSLLRCSSQIPMAAAPLPNPAPPPASRRRPRPRSRVLPPLQPGKSGRRLSPRWPPVLQLTRRTPLLRPRPPPCLGGTAMVSGAAG